MVKKVDRDGKMKLGRRREGELIWCFTWAFLPKLEAPMVVGDVDEATVAWLGQSYGQWWLEEAGSKGLLKRMRGLQEKERKCKGECKVFNVFSGFETRIYSISKKKLKNFKS